MTYKIDSSNENFDRIKKSGYSKTERLKGKQVIKKIFSKGKRFHRGNITIIYLLSEKQAAGFVASKKIGGAVKRNKVKRILREAYRMNKDIFEGLNVIFYAHGPLKANDILSTIKAFREVR